MQLNIHAVAFGRVSDFHGASDTAVVLGIGAPEVGRRRHVCMSLDQVNVLALKQGSLKDVAHLRWAYRDVPPALMESSYQ